MKSMVFSGLYGEVMYGKDCCLEYINCILYKIHFFVELVHSSDSTSIRDSYILQTLFQALLFT